MLLSRLLQISIMPYIILTFLLCILGVIWLTVKMLQKHSYWKKRNVLTMKPQFLFGNAKDAVLQKIPFGFDVTSFYSDLKRKAKMFGGYYTFFTPVFIPVDLNLIKKILISDSDHFINRVSHVDEKNDPLTLNLLHVHDERWKKLRSIISPSFSNLKIKMFLPIMMNQIKSLIDVVEETSKELKPLNVKEVLDRYMIDVTGMFTCATNFNTIKNKNSNLQRQFTDVYNTSTIDSLIRFLITAPEILKFFKIRVFSKKTTNFFFNLVCDIIHNRNKTKSETITVLDALVQCQIKQTPDNNQKITPNEIVANLTGLFLAGYEATSNTLTFCLYELASNLKIQEILRSEIDTLPKNPSYDDIASLSFLNKCINETFRKYPSATIITRKCTKTFHVPNSDIILEKGAHVYIPIQGVHWDPEYYPNPEKFDPERFTEEHLKNRHACMWLPFGAGPRLCVGYKLAILSMRVVLISLLKNYKLTVNCKTQLPIEYDPNGFILQPKYSVLLNVISVKDV